MRKLVVIALLALAAGVLVGCESRSQGEGGAAVAGGTLPEADAAQRAVAQGEAVAGSAEGTLTRSSSVPEIGPRVIQTASLRVSVPGGRFDEAIDEARSVAGRFGGFVVSSSASQGTGQRLVRGTLVIRIPARSYGDAIESLQGLGRVEARTESGQDVSQEYVDLQARVRQLEAVESQLLELLDRANSVGAALAVQNQLNRVQLDLEQARGRLQYLDDQVAFATISLAVHERLLPVSDGGKDGFGIVEAWSKAGHGFLAVIGWTFVVLATAAPILLLLVLAFLLVRLGLRGRLPWPRRRPA
jgi:hypothetical protein